MQAEQTLQARQGKDQDNETALDQDFTNFANALTAAAQQEKRPAAAKAMTALANDYNALVESQSGAADLPDMTTIESDGAAFAKACSLSLTPASPHTFKIVDRFPCWGMENDPRSLRHAASEGEPSAMSVLSGPGRPSQSLFCPCLGRRSRGCHLDELFSAGRGQSHPP
jgi:hypothetical protein